MSNEVSSDREKASTGYHFSSDKAIVSPERQLCEEMAKCYPPHDLKRLGIALLGVAVLFVVAAFVV